MSRNIKYLIAFEILVVIIVMLKVLPLWVTGICALFFGGRNIFRLQTT